MIDLTAPNSLPGFVDAFRSELLHRQDADLLLQQVRAADDVDEEPGADGTA